MLSFQVNCLTIWFLYGLYDLWMGHMHLLLSWWFNNEEGKDKCCWKHYFDAVLLYHNFPLAGKMLPLLPVVKTLFSHIWDVLSNVPSFQSEYGIILRHLLAVKDYRFHLRKRIYCSESFVNPTYICSWLLLQFCCSEFSDLSHFVLARSDASIHWEGGNKLSWEK